LKAKKQGDLGSENEKRRGSKIPAFLGLKTASCYVSYDVDVGMLQHLTKANTYLRYSGLPVAVLP
jgi:uncharacterized SAM-dependent methyltransferase